MMSRPAYGLIYLTKGEAHAVAHFDAEGNYLGTAYPEDRLTIPYVNRKHVAFVTCVEPGIYTRKGMFEIIGGKKGWQFVENVLDEDNFIEFIQSLPKASPKPIMVEVPHVRSNTHPRS